MHALEHLTRESGDPVFICTEGRCRSCQEVQGRTLTMDDHGKSYSPIVPAKPTNEGGEAHASTPEETVEGRGLAEESSRERSTHRTQSRGSVSHALARVRQAAEEDRERRFTALLHHVYNIDHLRSCYRALKRDASAGVDGQTWRAYGERLEEHLHDLSGRLRRGGYRVHPVRRAYIPKADGRQRPIGIPTLEDKIVQRATAAVLGAIYEADFLGFSHGFRPGHSPHHAVDAVALGIERKKVSWVLDADIRGFFDTLDHEWIMRFIEHRVADQRILRLIRKWLTAGVLEDGIQKEGEVGTVQGGSISPLLANIYLHYAFDLWVQHWRTHQARGEMIVVRFADDFVVGFQYRDEAERFHAALRERFARFGLELHAGKTRVIEFGRFAAMNRRQRGEGKPETFTFLGFTHICGTDRKGRFVVIRKTMRQRMQAKLREISAILWRKMHQGIVAQGQYLASVLRGHMQYYGVPRNIRSLTRFRWELSRRWKRVLERRSQRGRMTWERMDRLIARWLPPVRICQPYPNQRYAGII